MKPCASLLARIYQIQDQTLPQSFCFYGSKGCGSGRGQEVVWWVWSDTKRCGLVFKN